MSARPTFKITYWGVCGTMTAPLRPAEVTEKVVGAIRELVEKRQLQHLEPGDDLEHHIRDIVARELPFHLRSSYGGNSTCVEIETPDSLFILDCGSGFRELGVSLDARWRAAGASARRMAHVFVTHAHMDHTFATPFFVPYYNQENSVTLWGPQIVLDSLSAVLNPESSMSKLYFPPTYDEMKAIHDFRQLEANSCVQIGESRITTYALNHPGGASAYRIENGGCAYVFATDHEHPEVPDRGLAEFARDADILYTEGQYTQREYDGLDGINGDPAIERHGWGHSPIEACIKTAVAAGVKALHLGHRDPRRTDRDLADLQLHADRLMREELRAEGREEESCHVYLIHEGQQVQI